MAARRVVIGGWCMRKKILVVSPVLQVASVCLHINQVYDIDFLSKCLRVPYTAIFNNPCSIILSER